MLPSGKSVQTKPPGLVGPCAAVAVGGREVRSDPAWAYVASGRWESHRSAGERCDRPQGIARSVFDTGSHCESVCVDALRADVSTRCVLLVFGGLGLTGPAAGM